MISCMVLLTMMYLFLSLILIKASFKEQDKRIEKLKNKIEQLRIQSLRKKDLK